MICPFLRRPVVLTTLKLPPDTAPQTDKGKLSRHLHSQESRQLALALSQVVRRR
jgi:hypothetical protein